MARGSRHNATDDSSVTDPASYGNRDLLLLTQLLHTNQLIEPTSITKDSKLIGDISTEWYNHISTKLSRERDHLNIQKPLTNEQICQLYQNLLEINKECNNTTDLANHYYFTRIDELNDKINNSKNQFSSLLQECND